MAPKLEYSKSLGKMVRTESLDEQGILTWDLVRDAILDSKPDEAIEWLRYIRDSEGPGPKGPGSGGGAQRQLAYIANKYGEEHVQKAIRWWRKKLMDAGNEPTYCMTPLERAQFHGDMERAAYSGPEGEKFEVKQEKDRYVMTLDPCGACGKARRAEVEGAGAKLGKTSKRYKWSWGKANVPYYCAHNCVWWEVMAIEDIGYPVMIYEWSEDPNEPCKVYFYKDPNLIPEKYFTRLGFKKDPKRFK